jgi:hypothetical protein
MIIIRGLPAWNLRKAAIPADPRRWWMTPYRIVVTPSPKEISREFV